MKYMGLRIACVPFWYMVLRVPLINIASEDSKQKKKDDSRLENKSRDIGDG